MGTVSRARTQLRGGLNDKERKGQSFSVLVPNSRFSEEVASEHMTTRGNATKLDARSLFSDGKVFIQGWDNAQGSRQLLHHGNRRAERTLHAHCLNINSR